MEYVAKRAVNLPVSDLLDLELHLIETRPGVKPDVFIADLIKRWLSIDMERIALLKNGPAMRGFQWKNVFLPEGTTLRTRYQDIIEFARVVGNRILSDDGESLTPSLFVNRRAQGRNAWRFIWLRFPGQDQWIRAIDYRARIREHLQETS